MYILIEQDRLPEGRHYEKMPDGRCIVSGREARMMGTLEDVTIVMNTAELEKLRRVKSPEQTESANKDNTAVNDEETITQVNDSESNESVIGDDGVDGEQPDSQEDNDTEEDESEDNEEETV